MYSIVPTIDVEGWGTGGVAAFPIGYESISSRIFFEKEQ